MYFIAVLLRVRRFLGRSVLTTALPTNEKPGNGQAGFVLVRLCLFVVWAEAIDGPGETGVISPRRIK
jgi:hypothetical protein